MLNEEARLPDVIGLGSRRCASSTVHAMLNEHPSVGKPPRGTHFFSEHYDQGKGWYMEQLAAHQECDVLVEFSVSYSYPDVCEAAAARIHEHCPDAKLFMTVRNPIERAFSDYLRSLRLCEIDARLPFTQALGKYPELLSRGMYARGLNSYLKYFREDQIHVLWFDDLQSDAGCFAQQLFNFLGVTPMDDTHPGSDPLRGSKYVRSQGLNRLLFSTKERLDQSAAIVRATKPWEALKRSCQPLYQQFLCWNARHTEIDNEVRRQLRKYYDDDIKQLEDLTGRVLDVWS